MRITIATIREKKRNREKITMLTAYDYASAKLLDEAGIDMLLVGDSLGMVVLGYESTLPVTLEEMLHHTSAVTRGARRALVVGDMPFMTYQASVSEAMHNAGRFLKEAGAQAVKLEGGVRMAETVARLVENHGIDYVVLRYPNVYGPRQDPHGEAGVVAIFSLQLLTGQRPTIFGDGSKTRDYCYVSDIVDANVLALSADNTGTYNLGRGIEISDLEVFETIQETVGTQIEPNFAPVRPGEVEHIALDASKAEKELGWKWKVDLIDGVAESVKYYRMISERMRP